MKIFPKDVIRIRKPQPRYPVIKPIADRFSPRHFSPKKIPQKDLNSIFEAARLAPSGYNYQPWFFYWTENNSSAFKKTVSCFPSSNYWAKTAAIFIIACYLPVIDKEPDRYALYDLGASVMSLVLQTQHLGYYARQIGNCDTEKLKKIFNLEKDQQPFVVIALGKLGDYKDIEEVFLQKDIRPHPKKTQIVKKLT
jgi:nitroreductase